MSKFQYRQLDRQEGKMILDHAQMRKELIKIEHGK
jgi:hypothetical protein